MFAREGKELRIWLSALLCHEHVGWFLAWDSPRLGCDRFEATEDIPVRIACLKSSTQLHKRRMNPVAFKACHDGQQVCFDEPCDLAANTRLLVVPDAEEAFRRDWFEPENRSWGAHPPRVSLDAPRVQPFGAGPPPKRLELFSALGVFREGAENRTRGACAPYLNFGVRVEISSQALACASGDDEADYSSAIIREKLARE